MEKCQWPDQEELTRRIRIIKARRNRPYAERAAAKRIMAMMQREKAGEFGDMPLGEELDVKLIKLLL